MDQREPSRTRNNGTITVKTTTGEERIAACRQIVERGQYGKIDGLMVDYTSASAIITVHDALKPESRVKLYAMDISKMARACFGAINKANARCA